MTVSLYGILTSNFCFSLYAFILASLMFASEHKSVQNLSFIVGIISFGFFCFAVRDTIWFVQYSIVDTKYIMVQSGAEIMEKAGLQNAAEAMETLKLALK